MYKQKNHNNTVSALRNLKNNSCLKLDFQKVD